MKDETENSILLSFTLGGKTAQVEATQLKGGGKQFVAYAGKPNARKCVITKTGGEREDRSLTALWLDGNCAGKADAVAWLSDCGAMQWAALVALTDKKAMLPIRTDIESTESPHPLEEDK